MKISKLKIKFVDFWAGFIEDDNYFFNLLSVYYEIQLSNQPDILFYSCYGKEYLNYNCTRVFYTAENLRPDFTGCDYAITFDYNNNKNHFRLPLYVLYIDGANNLQQLLEPLIKEEALKLWKQKTKFCCMVVSNPNAKKRIEFFKRISQKKHIDSGGRYLNNIIEPITDKLEFIKDYKFVISFENSSYKGYTTEKILDPLMVHSIPIYWGNPCINNDFNKDVFINVDNYENYDDVLERMLEIESDDEIALLYLIPPKLVNNESTIHLDKYQVFLFLKNIIDNLHKKKPIAKTNKLFIHRMKRYFNTIQYYILSLTIGNFR